MELVFFCGCIVFVCTGLDVVTCVFGCCFCKFFCGGKCDCLCLSAVYIFNGCVSLLLLLVSTLKEIGIS